MTNELAAVTLPPEEVENYLTAEEVSGMIKMPVTELVAQARTFQVPALWCVVDGADEPTPFFTLDFARRISVIRSGEPSETRKLVVPLYNLLREYVKEYPPVSLYADSVEDDRPWLGRAGSRWGRLHVHVVADAVATFAVEVGADVQLRTGRTVSKVLRLMRAQSVKGARDTFGHRVPRTVWRLPLTVVDPGESEQS